MPRRRTTRAAPAKRQIPPLPEDSSESNLDEEERRKKLETLILDFKTEIASRVSSLKSDVVRVVTQIDHAYSTELIKIPLEKRNMKLNDFLAQGGSFQPATVSEVQAFLDSNQESVSEEGKGEILAKTVKANKRVRKVQAPETALQTTRCTGRTRKAVLETPVVQNRMVLPMQTPLIMPKFDPRLYQTVAASARLPRHGEAVMSMEGSPLANLAVPPQNTQFLVPVDRSKTLDIWDIIDDPESVDENTLREAFQTTEELKKRLGAIIKFKPKNK